MNRRAMVVLPGIALGASRVFAQTQSTTSSSTSTSTPSHKTIARYSSLKSFYTIPKNESKQAKYISFLTTLLSLSQSQQTEAAKIFSTASASHAEAKANLKAARQSLGEAVRANDTGAINRASSTIGRLGAQQHLAGANAQAAFYQILSADQQTKLNQFRS